MKIEHVAVWTARLEHMKRFYETYFKARAGKKYINVCNKFSSYFLTFSTGARLEIMSCADVGPPASDATPPFVGLAHFAVSVGSEENVAALTQRLVDDGYLRLDGPRFTGDGYYESVILDPDGNRVEITV